MKKSQIRCVVGNSLILLASILIISFFALNIVEGGGFGSIYSEITSLNTFTGVNRAYFMIAGISLIVVLILSGVMVILSALGLCGNRAISIINLILASLAFAMIITYVALLATTAMVGAGVITTFLLSILCVVGAFVAQSRKIYRA